MGRVTDSESCWACCCRAESCAFIGHRPGRSGTKRRRTAPAHGRSLGGVRARLHCKASLRRYEPDQVPRRSEEHTSELQSQSNLVCRLLLEKKKKEATRL